MQRQSLPVNTCIFFSQQCADVYPIYCTSMIVADSVKMIAAYIYLVHACCMSCSWQYSDNHCYEYVFIILWQSRNHHCLRICMSCSSWPCADAHYPWMHFCPSTMRNLPRSLLPLTLEALGWLSVQWRSLGCFLCLEFAKLCDHIPHVLSLSHTTIKVIYIYSIKN